MCLCVCTTPTHSITASSPLSDSHRAHLCIVMSVTHATQSISRLLRTLHSPSHVCYTHCTVHLTSVTHTTQSISASLPLSHTLHSPSLHRYLLSHTLHSACTDMPVTPTKQSISASLPVSHTLTQSVSSLSPRCCQHEPGLCRVYKSRSTTLPCLSDTTRPRAVASHHSPP